MIDENEYMKNRLDEQIAWHSMKAAQNKSYHLRTSVVSIICAALISLDSGFDFIGHKTAKNILLGVLGTVVAVLTAIATLLKYQEKWTEYRTISETLTQEKMMFGTRTGPYDKLEKEGDAFKLLVTRVENIISKENSTWKQYITKNDTGKTEVATG